MGDAFRPGCCHPAVATRSPSSAPFVHTRPARTRQQLVVVRLLPSGNPARFRRTNSRGFDWCASSGHTSSTARKGRSFWRVPSLGRGCSLHLLNIRTGLHSSTEKVSSGSQTPPRPPNDAETRFPGTLGRELLPAPCETLICAAERRSHPRRSLRWSRMAVRSESGLFPSSDDPPGKTKSR
jgi:hypothetical protein